jgi:uncharacterized protein YmfQ (DUF2313 family)
MAGGFQPGAFQPNAFQMGPANADAYARMLRALLPPGRAWRTDLQSVLHQLLLGSADELARVEGRARDLVRESNPATAIELLPEYELEYGVAAAATTAERQARIVARRVLRQRFRPADFQTALAVLLAQAPASVVVIERTHAQAVAMGDEREIFRFFIYRDPTLPGIYFLASAQEIVNAMKPSHTIGTVIESIAALYDDPHSLYDRDLMGA